MNWGALKAAVADWASRNDLTAMMPTFLALAEQRIYQGMSSPDVDPLRLSTMIKSVGAFTGTLPTDCERVHRITVASGGAVRPLEWRPLTEIAPYCAQQGTPAYYSIRAKTVVYGPQLSNTSAVELLYYARFQTPAIDTDHNELMTASPGVYLYAMLCEVATYLRDDALLTMAVQLFASAQNSAMENDSGNTHGGGPLRIMSDQMARV